MASAFSILKKSLISVDFTRYAVLFYLVLAFLGGTCRLWPFALSSEHCALLLLLLLCIFIRSK